MTVVLNIFINYPIKYGVSLFFVFLRFGFNIFYSYIASFACGNLRKMVECIYNITKDEKGGTMLENNYFKKKVVGNGRTMENHPSGNLFEEIVNKICL